MDDKLMLNCCFNCYNPVRRWKIYSQPDYFNLKSMINHKDVIFDYATLTVAALNWDAVDAVNCASRQQSIYLEVLGGES
ncbi:MAG: hypothetical protein KatS3mg087_1645 [Patescibacteria group bacterium]|nr:MAG: hypothetical protein KatS3mg087_1645 [Patescibacteria group bacterium]